MGNRDEDLDHQKLTAGRHTTFAQGTTMNITTTKTAPAGLQQLIDRHFALRNNTNAEERAKGFADV